MRGDVFVFIWSSMCVCACGWMSDCVYVCMCREVWCVLRGVVRVYACRVVCVYELACVRVYMCGEVCCV